MSEKPILFSGPMVRAIIEGRKTMTRRVVKRNCAGRAELHGKQWHIQDPNSVLACPYGQPGNTLWVRETWGIHECADAMYQRDRCEVGRGLLHYQADEGLHPVPRWRSPRFMPRWASRITLRVMSVRVERLQEITREDAKAEGAEEAEEGSLIGPRFNFMNLWDSINAKRGYGWAVNSWVWVVGFEVVEVRP